MSTKILVTGANGQLGKTIEELYSDNQNGLDFIFASKAELDITKEKELRLFFNNKFDYCINCAAYTNVEQAEKTPESALKVNAEGVKNLAGVCKETNTILIHVSTDYVFDGEKFGPYSVQDIPSPINEYGKSKLLGERYIRGILDSYFIIRTSWLYSKHYGHNFYRTILEKAKTENKLIVTDQQIGCPTNTTTLSKYIIDIIINRDNNFGIRHFSDGKPMTWFSFAQQILLENNISNEVKLVQAKNYRTFAERPRNSILQNSN
ncbi:dTDP-4-dehydrorhamnose reductase [Flavivirga abyssicola]|uniref:dTDP-4-dehydrorhamnose reductase n=1 Tax=Flavivirga abyssicola TaxID=3063533 RepID=UPI0026E0BA4F|nr:dTDP-4-dehydrorhamnose reductase [Flavivirga sp. MEBiC07777]WVK14807.1 dTDP-4-dehydrorhamnose reductase [Flavivirga sp. MEBiC07777]